MMYVLSVFFLLFKYVPSGIPSNIKGIDIAAKATRICSIALYLLQKTGRSFPPNPANTAIIVAIIDGASADLSPL